MLTIAAASLEPQSVKTERLARQKTESSQKAETEKNKSERTQPTKKTVQTKSKVGFRSIENNDSSLSKGQKRVSVEGVDGERTETYEVTYVDGAETGRKLISDEITKAAIDKVILIGTYVAPAQTQVQTVYNSLPTAPAPAPAPAPESSTGAYYANCTEVKDAGAAPIYSGQPGYSRSLDRDGDGIACEK